MSRRHSLSAEIAHLRAEIKGKTNEQIEEHFGIEIKEDGTVYDQADGEEYKTLNEWMKSYAKMIIDDEDEYDDAYKGNFDEDDF